MWQVKLAWDIGLFLSPLRGYRHLDLLCPGLTPPATISSALRAYRNTPRSEYPLTAASALDTRRPT